MKASCPQSVKFLKLKRRLKIPQWQCVGLLESIWLIGQHSAKAGDIGKLSNEDIAASIEWEGDPDELIQNLVECGFLDTHPKHRLIIHDWSEHCPTWVKGNIHRAGASFAGDDDESKDESNEPTKDASKYGTKHGTKDTPREHTTKPSQAYSDTDTDTGGFAPDPERTKDWTRDHPDLEAVSWDLIAPLPIGRLSPDAVFAEVTAEVIRSPPAIVSWFRRQLSAKAPVLGPTRADLLLAMCASLKACERGVKKPPGVFVNVICNRAWNAVKRYRDRAELLIDKEIPRDDCADSGRPQPDPAS